MNAKRQQAVLHARQLRQAKEQLLEQVNLRLGEAQKQGYEAQVLPQIQRLISLEKYRQRDVQKMQALIANPQRLESYIFSVDKSTGEIVSGYEAYERRQRYERSGIYKPARDEPPKESDIMVQNVSEEMEKAFVDESASIAFRQFLTDLTNDPQGTSGDMAFMLHEKWSKLNSNELYYATGQMVTENANNLFTIRSALESLVQKEGPGEVSKRISDNWEVLQQECITATIGYKRNASMAMQTVLKIFLPSDRQPGNIRYRISDMQDLYDSQFDDFEE